MQELQVLTVTDASDTDPGSHIAFLHWKYKTNMFVTETIALANL